MTDEHHWQLEEHYTFAGDPNSELADSYGDELAKVNSLFGVATLAQELWEKGLLGLVNHAVLHNYGYAIGVDTTDPDENGDRRIFGLALYKTTDPEGIWFDEATLVAIREKLSKAGLR